uniref:PSP proline-rich domain-containing protein n=1 Tax=Anopheles farauti TaxID=69004 RepID=A0A182QP49_9DIPT
MDENITKQSAADGDPDPNDSDVEIIESAKDETICIEDNEPDKVAQSNDTPLVTIRFRSDKLYEMLHKSITMAVTAALKGHHTIQHVSVVPGSDGLSLEVTENDNPVMEDESTDSLFVIDSTPMKDRKKNAPIPSYKKSMTKVFDGQTPKASDSKTTKRPRAKQTCWNCEGEHGLKDCKAPRNYTRIRQKKEEFQKKGDRYHADLEQRYGHFQPGRISAGLCAALGLGPRDLPLHVYRMRIFGYPPGWLEEAKITHSGLQLFGSNGDAIAHSEDDEGEVDNVRQKYDVRKIIEYPGFNEPPAPELFDDSKYFKVPPYTEELSRDSMMRRLEGTLVGGYRRKKLKLASEPELEEYADRSANTETVDMDAMECSPGSPEPMEPPERSRQPNQLDHVKDLEDGELSSDTSEGNEPVKVSSSSNDDLQASVILVETPVEVISLDDTPVIMPVPDAPASPSITELEEKQKQLVDQLSGNSFAAEDNSFLNDILLAEKLAETDGNDQSMAESTSSEPSLMEPPPPPPWTVNPPPPPPSWPANPPPIIEVAPSERPPEPDSFDLDELAMNKVPYIDEPASAGLKRMSLGTPILRAFTPYSTLPSGDAFSKGVSDVIHFENLPDSTGKYEQMKSLLSEVRLRMNEHLRET